MAIQLDGDIRDIAINKDEQAITPAREDLLRTPTARKIMALLTTPSSAKLTVLELCRLNEIPTETYYYYLRKPEFLAAVREMRAAHLQSLVPTIVGHAVESAAIPGRDGHQDRKLLLEMAGEYKQELDVTSNNRITIEYVNDWRGTGAGVVDSTAEEVVSEQ